MPAENRDVFVNCPFDAPYRRSFNAIVFTVIRSGFRARCALEADDAAQNRFGKICSIIKECRFGVHDISRTELDGDPPLPRFNMPLELGVFLGAQHFGGRGDKAKRCIIFDREPHRYQRYMSDIAGQDIHSHGGTVPALIRELASWLRLQSGDPAVPGGVAISAHFERFEADLPDICRARQLEPEELNFGDLSSIIGGYLSR